MAKLVGLSALLATMPVRLQGLRPWLGNALDLRPSIPVTAGLLQRTLSSRRGHLEETKFPGSRARQDIDPR